MPHAQSTFECHVRPDPDEAIAMRALQHQVDEIYANRETARLIGPDGAEVEIPASAFEALKCVVEGMAQGLTMTLVPHDAVLTTQQAADLLHLSRPYLVKLLERQEIPFHRVGSHRRVKIDDVLKYRQRRISERRRQLAELTELAETAEGGYR